MRSSLRLFLLLLGLVLGDTLLVAQAQNQPTNTVRSGSSGSSGTTQQGPPYDTGVRGPTGPMGPPDMTAVERESSGAITKKKKPVGTIRLDAGPGVAPTPSPTPTPSPASSPVSLER